MGIRFRCPNGHKLNVKSFLAGKRGICPHCGVKVAIPTESDPQLRKDRKAVTSAAPQGSVPVSNSLPGQAVMHTPSAVVAPSETDDELPRSGQQSPLNTRVQSAAIQSSVTSESTSGGASPNAPPETTIDPISEAPHAVWYVRPPSGGQYGPATGDIMRNWIAEGRVTGDTLVWREGWSEWKPAGAMFPGLVDGPVAIKAPEIPDIITEDVSRGASPALYRRKKSSAMAIGVVVMLVIACIILFGAFIFVIKLQ